MMRAFLVTLTALSIVALAGCGERDQSLTSTTNKSDGKPWQGANNGFMDKNWKPGDRAVWDNQMRNRAQTQNEYVKVN